MGAPRAPLGTRITVCSLTPSRIGIMTSRRTWSKLSTAGCRVAGVSLGRSGYWGVFGETDWAPADATSDRTATTGPASFMGVPPAIGGADYHPRAPLC